MSSHNLEINILISGIENAMAYSGGSLEASETITVAHPSSTLPHCVSVRLRIPIEIPPGTPLRVHLDSTVPELFNIAVACLALLLPRPFDVLASNTSCDGHETSINPPARRVPAQLYILSGFLKPDPGRSHLWCQVRPELWPALESIFLRFLALQAELRNRVRLAMHWAAKAAGETSGADRLVAFWMAFNALYATPSDSSERAAIQKLVRSQIDNEMGAEYVKKHEWYMRELANYPLELKLVRGQLRVDAELRRQLSTPSLDPAAITEAATLCAYAVRNRLFHGRMDLATHGDQYQLEMAEVLVGGLVRTIVVKIIATDWHLLEDFVIKEEFAM